jgi:hypothetical protein
MKINLCLARSWIEPVWVSNRAELTVRTLEKMWAQEQDQAEHKQEKILNNLKRSHDCYARGYILLDAADNKWKIMHLNGAAMQELGVQLINNFRNCNSPSTPTTLILRLALCTTTALPFPFHATHALEATGKE